MVREPFFEDSAKIIELRHKRKIYCYLTTQSIANIFYILRKDFNIEERKNILYAMCLSFMICPVNGEITVKALLDKKFTDFEDCIQSLCAGTVRADYIITRNIKDYIGSEVKAITPADFLALDTPKI
jgi:hypothetical protein